MHIHVCVCVYSCVCMCVFARVCICVFRFREGFALSDSGVIQPVCVCDLTSRKSLGSEIFPHTRTRSRRPWCRHERAVAQRDEKMEQANRVLTEKDELHRRLMQLRSVSVDIASSLEEKHGLCISLEKQFPEALANLPC